MKTKLIAFITMLTMFTITLTDVNAVDYGEELRNQPSRIQTESFTDVSDTHWAFEYIEEMVDRGVLSGYPNGKFYPNNKVTRAEFAKIMVTAANLPLSSDDSQIYEDVDEDNWAFPYINSGMIYLTGYSNEYGNYYYPNQPALREDIAVALVKLKGYDTLGADLSLLTVMFEDESSISTEAKKYVATAIERGLISGYEDDTFRGQSSITRAEAATLLWRAYQYGNDNKYVGVVATPKPTATVRPTSTPKVTDDDDEDDEVIETSKSYNKTHRVRTIARNAINSSNTFRVLTFDSDNDIVYYYNEDDNVIYKYDINDDSLDEYLDVNDLCYIIDDEEFTDDIDDEYGDYYKDFTVRTIGYDEYDNRLYVTVKTNTVSDIDGLDDMKLDDTKCFGLYMSKRGIYECEALDVYAGYEEGLLSSSELIDRDTFDTIAWVGNIRSSGLHELFSNNKAYSILRINNEDKSKLVVYDFSSWETIRELESISRYALTGENYYFWDRENERIIKSTKKGKLSVILDVDDIEIDDMKPISSQEDSSSTGEKFIVNEDEDKILFIQNGDLRLIEKTSEV